MKVSTKKKNFPKKTILIVIASIAGFLLLAALGWYLYFISQFSVYQDDQYKFSIKYPKTWKVRVHPQKNVAVIFLRPKDTVLDPLQASFNVTVQTAPEMDRTLTAFSATVKRQMTAVFGKNIVIVSDKTFQSGWHQGHLMAFDIAKPDHLKMVNGWLLRGDQAYVLTFFGDMNKYAGDYLYVNEMIHSFDFQ